MATPKLKNRQPTKTRKRTARSPARAKRATKVAAKAKPRHRFSVKRFRPEDFKGDGLRTYAHYRDLGVRDATRGMVVAHAIRFVEPCDPEVVSKERYGISDDLRAEGLDHIVVRRARHAYHDCR